MILNGGAGGKSGMRFARARAPAASARGTHRLDSEHENAVSGRHTRTAATPEGGALTCGSRVASGARQANQAEANSAEEGDSSLGSPCCSRLMRS